MVWMSTATTTTAPPTTVISAGVSPTATHAQNGPSTTSSRVISATSGAGISRAPTVRNASPAAIWPTPSGARTTRSCPVTGPPLGERPDYEDDQRCERQIAGTIEMSRR